MRRMMVEAERRVSGRLPGIGLASFGIVSASPADAGPGLHDRLPDPVGSLHALAACGAPGAEVLVTTRNRLMSVSENPYHLREWMAPELHALAAAVFPGVEVLSGHGSARVLAYECARGEAVQRSLRWDSLGLGPMVLGVVVREIFPRLARLVRRRLSAEGFVAAVGPDDFRVGGDDLAHALDLVLVIRKEAGG